MDWILSPHVRILAFVHYQLHTISFPQWLLSLTIGMMHVHPEHCRQSVFKMYFVSVLLGFL